MNPSPLSNAWPQPQSVAHWFQHSSPVSCRTLVGTIRLQQVELLLHDSTLEPSGPIVGNLLACLELRESFTIEELANRMRLSKRLIRSTVDFLRRQSQVEELSNGMIRLTAAGKATSHQGSPSHTRHRRLFELRNGHYLAESADRLVLDYPRQVISIYRGGTELLAPIYRSSHRTFKIGSRCHCIGSFPHHVTGSER